MAKEGIEVVEEMVRANPTWRINGERCMWFGTMASELSREHLIALVGFLGEKMEDEKEFHKRSMELMSDLGKR